MNKLITALLLTAILVSCKKTSTEDENYYTLAATVVDFDASTPIAAAKVYVIAYIGGAPLDSALSDVNGKVAFSFKKEGPYKFLTPVKNNYINPMNTVPAHLNYDNRTEFLYLARPSYVNVTVHKTGTYLPSDSVNVQVTGDYAPPPIFQNPGYRLLFKDKAEAPDKIFNLQSAYGRVMGSFFFGASKLHFTTDIIRNGAVISTQKDSTSLIQFSIKNYTLNY
ncbi:hypothetical protein [Ferruginibacter sp.]|nr:hypothetical protein [Ferruginibacter sp.]